MNTTAASFNEGLPVGNAGYRTQFGNMEVGKGLRGKWYLTSLIGFIFIYILGPVGIKNEWMAPSPFDDYAGTICFLGFWVALFAFVDNVGEKRTKIQKYEEFVFIWLVTSGLGQLLWELPFALMKTTYMYDLGAELQTDQWWLFPWWMYSVGDTRFQTFNTETHALETMIAFTGPIQLWAAYCIKTGKKYKAGLIAAGVLHWGILWTNTATQYISEIYGGLSHIGDGASGFWIKWIGLNLHWSTISALCTFLSIYLLQQKCEEEAVARHLGLYKGKHVTDQAAFSDSAEAVT